MRNHSNKNKHKTKGKIKEEVNIEFIFSFFFIFLIKEGDNFIASFCLTWHINEVLFKICMSFKSIAFDMILTHSLTLKRSFVIQVN